MLRRWMTLSSLLAASMLMGIPPVTAQVPQVPQLPNQLPHLPTDLPGAAPATPTITSPKGGATVGSPIVVKGTAAKGVKVKVTATLAAAIPVSGLSTKVGEAEATADDKGAWQVSIPVNIPMKVSGAKIVIEAVATNPMTGQKSSPAKVEVVPKT